MSLWALPFALAKNNEDVINHDDMKGTLADEELLISKLDEFKSKQKRIFDRNPYIKTILLGNFQEILERKVIPSQWFPISWGIFVHIHKMTGVGAS